jgi:5-methylcytosine-specific restriction endonuclease McrA
MDFKKGASAMLIYILNASGKPLMPTQRTNHIKRLLNKGKARIISKTPYVVQLKYETECITQPLYGGTDPGRTNIGEAVVDSRGFVIYKAHIETRNKDIPKLMAERKQHRQASRHGERLRRKRRACKCGTTTTFPKGRMLPGYEKPMMLKDIINTESRFNNRKRPSGWVTPTVRQLVQTHTNMIHKICSILPVTDWIMEYNKFAFMRMDDNTIKGLDFQNGRMKGYSNSHEYVSALQNGKCACCNSNIEHFHHIKPRHEKGSDTPENLIGLCNTCHSKVHSGDIKLEQVGLKKKYAALSVLNQSMPYIAQELINMFGEDHVRFCTGYQTSVVRDSLGIDKDHPEDAICIALFGAGITECKDIFDTFKVKQYRRHNRQRVHAQRERTYYLNGKTVCKNRHKRNDQKGDSLEEFRTKFPDNVGRLTVKKSTRHYNRMNRMFPGAIFIYQGNEHILTGQHSGGAYYHADGLAKNGVLSKMCGSVKQNTGLVYQC